MLEIKRNNEIFKIKDNLYIINRIFKVNLSSSLTSHDTHDRITSPETLPPQPQNVVPH